MATTRATTGQSESADPNREAAEAASGEEEVRSNYGEVPGGEFPAAVYISAFAAFLWVVLAALIAFANGSDADLALGMAAVLTIVFFALPVLIRLTSRSHPRTARVEQGDFLSRRVETATGSLSGGSAWLQIVLIPAALALAATLIGATSMLVH